MMKINKSIQIMDFQNETYRLLYSPVLLISYFRGLILSDLFIQMTHPLVETPSQFHELNIMT